MNKSDNKTQLFSKIVIDSNIIKFGKVSAITKIANEHIFKIHNNMIVTICIINLN